MGSPQSRSAVASAPSSIRMPSPARSRARPPPAGSPRSHPERPAQHHERRRGTVGQLERHRPSGSDPPVTSRRVAVLDLARIDDGHRLEAAVRVLADAEPLARRREFQRPGVVEEQERIDPRPEVGMGEERAHGKPVADPVRSTLRWMPRSLFADPRSPIGGPFAAPQRGRRARSRAQCPPGRGEGQGAVVGATRGAVGGCGDAGAPGAGGGLAKKPSRRCRRNASFSSRCVTSGGFG